MRVSVRPAAFELHGVGPGVLHEPDRVLKRLVLSRLIRAERQVGDDDGAAHGTRHRARQHQHLVHRHRQRGLVAEHRHRRGIADQDDVEAGRVGEPRAAIRT